MTLLPIVARELRVAARRRSTYRARNGAALLSILVTALALGLLELQFSISQGKSVFSTLAIMAFGYCLLAGTRATSDCISAEKRAGTIGLLFLTRLKGYDVILGKLVSSGLTAFYGLLATVPVLALALPLGGVTAGEVVRMALLFINTLFLSMAAGVFASTVSRNDRRALIATACIIIAVAGVPYVLAVGWAIWLGYQGRPPNSLWEFAAVLKLSPLFAFQIARAGLFTRSMLADFYGSLLLAHLAAWSLLAAASWIVPRVCRERPAGRLGWRWLQFQNRWRYGRPASRRAFRKRLLDRNAFYWLAARDRIKAHYVWLFVLGLAGIWCWAGWQMESFTFDWDASLLLLFLLFVFFKVWFASEVCSHWVEHRESGAFEVLLSSPLNLKELAHGQSLALWRQFGRPMLFILGLTFLLLTSALRASHYNLTRGEMQFLFVSLMLILVADLLTLKWVGMWQGITTGRIDRALTATCVRVLLLPAIVFLPLYGIGALVLVVFWPGPQNAGTWGLTGLLWLVIALAMDLFFGLRSRRRFLDQFREVATQRFNPSPAGWEFWPKLWEALRRPFQRQPPTTAGAVLLRACWKPWWVRGTALLVLILAAAFGMWRYQLAREVRAQLATIRAAGLPVTSSDLEKWLPVVPEEENAGVILQRAAPLLVLPQNQWPQPASYRLFYSGPGLRNLSWAGGVNSPSAELQTTVANVLAQNRPGLDLLHHAAALNKSRMPLDRTQGPPQVAASIQVTRLRPAGPLLQMDAWLALLNDEPHRAAETALVLFALARLMDQEPMLAARYERLLLLNAALGVLERILNEHSLPEPMLEQFGRKLEEAASATGPALARAFIVERCVEFEAFQSLGTQNAARWSPGRSTGEQLLVSAASSAGVFLGLRDRMLLRFLGKMPPLIERAQWMGQEGLPELAASASAGPVFNDTQDHWENLFNQQRHLVAQLRIAAVGVAIARFRLAHQRLPTDLEELQPQFLSKSPADPVGSLQFEPLNPGYSVYRFGPGSELRRIQRHRSPAQVSDDLSFNVRR